MKKLCSLITIIAILFLSGCSYIQNEPIVTDDNITENNYENNRDTIDDSSLYDKITSKAQNDPKYAWIKAFLDKNTDDCSNMAIATQKDYWGDREANTFEWYNSLKDFDIGEYSITEQSPDVIFTFEVTNSNNDVFPVGEYTYRVYDSVTAAVGWERLNTDDYCISDDLYDLILVMSPHITSFSAQDYDPSNKNLNSGIFKAIQFCSTKWLGNSYGLTENEVENIAFEMFGINNYAPDENTAQYENGLYVSKHPGGTVVFMDVVECTTSENNITIYCQFYADTMRIAKSYYVKYDFQIIESDYRYKLISAEILDEGVYPPLVCII